MLDSTALDRWSLIRMRPLGSSPATWVDLRERFSVVASDRDRFRASSGIAISERIPARPF